MQQNGYLSQHLNLAQQCTIASYVRTLYTNTFQRAHCVQIHYKCDVVMSIQECAHKNGYSYANVLAHLSKIYIPIHTYVLPLGKNGCSSLVVTVTKITNIGVNMLVVKMSYTVQVYTHTIAGDKMAASAVTPYVNHVLEEEELRQGAETTECVW